MVYLMQIWLLSIVFSLRLSPVIQIKSWNLVLFIKVKKAKIRNQYNQVPHLTQDKKQESNKNLRKHHTLESQEVSPFPAGDTRL